MSRKQSQPANKGKKGNSKHEQEVSFAEVETNPLISDYISKLRTDFQKLKMALFQWSMASGKLNYYGKKEVVIIKQYIKHHHDYYQYDQFQGSLELLPTITGINYSQVASQQLIFKSFDWFKRSAVWPIRFDSKFIAKLNEFNLNQVYYVLGFVYFLAAGNFYLKSALPHNVQYGNARPLDILSIPFNRFFSVKIFREKNIFVHIGVEKTPVVKNGVIKRYEYRSFMNFLDILGDIYLQNRNKFTERMNVFKDQIFNDVAKKDHIEQLQIDKGAILKKHHYFFSQVYNEYTQKSQYYQQNIPQKQQRIFHPLSFKPYYMSTSEMSTLIFDQNAKRWLSKDHLNFMERKKIAEYQKQISDSLIKRFVDFQSAKTLVELLTKIPNFNINLTEQEKEVIGENGNVLAIGRSGTGKTTCAVLRLFSIEMLFKIRLSIYKKKYEETVKDVRCESSDIDNTMGLHCIFLTASPVLTHQIQRYYRKLTDNIKNELERKKKKLAQQKKRQAQIIVERPEEQSISKSQMSFEQLNQSSNVSQEIQEIKDQTIREEESLPEKLVARKSAEDLEEENQINEEFKDISLKEDINNQQFHEQEEDIDELKVKFEENIKKYHNLYDLQEKDYPGFFTVKSFIMMIDGVLPKPFFIRSKNTIINQDSNAAWHNQRKGVMMIENYYKSQEEETEVNIDQIEEEINYSDEEQLEHQYLRQIQLKQKKEKQQLTKKLQKNKGKQVLSFEVDYQYFVVHFWPRVVRKYYSTSKNITAHLVWTEIYSTIKGSATSHQYPTQFLTQNAYMAMSSNTFLTREEKLDIYETFCQYQRWKIKAGGYDIMDAVNYILNYIRFRSYQGPELHYVMIDEVQDLPHAIVYLFSKVATYGVFYSGDTAQTIAKGVGFRFCDLKSLFNPKILDHSINLKTPAIKHLTINFRSHNNILQLANSIVSSIEILFPKTIDRMKKEISDLSGPKPMILPSNDEELLFYVLCGDEKKPEQGESMLKKSPLQFGCDQVIIVRDQESKNHIPAMLQHALCLTIYEAKGLQFNDVILFNFFAESPCADKWHLLKTLDVVSSQIPREEYEKNLSKHKVVQGKKIEQSKAEDEIEQEVAVDEKFNKETNTYSVKKITNNKYQNIAKDINDFAQLCSELKLLYTAITRPRKTLIIYDHGQCPARASIERLWEKLNVIEIITKDIVLDCNKKGNQRQELKIFNKIVASTDSQSWKQQGLKMYARGYFDQAMKCFERSGHRVLYQKAEANKHADDATKKLIEIQSERNSIKQGFHTYREMSNTEVAKIKKHLKKEQGLAIERFKKAGAIFEDLLMFKQAGQCYFSGKLFQTAFECFCKAFMHKQAAESLEMMNKYREAAEYYEKDGMYLKVIECLDLVNEWSLILQKIQQFSDKMTQFQKQALLKKYSALALQQLVYEIEFENEEQQKKPENNKVEVIQEKESDEQEQWDSDEDPQLVAEREYQRKVSEAESSENPSRKVSEAQEDRQLIDIKGSVYQTLGQSQKQPQQHSIDVKKEQREVSDSFSGLNDSKAEQLPKEGLKSIEMSFGDLNQSADKAEVLKESIKPELQEDIISLQSSFSDLNAKYQDNLAPDLQSIKSMVDPDDLWVKNSISEIGHKLHSQYSVLDEDEESYNLNVKIIKTKGNIFVQDEIMKKIVNIVSIINTSVHQFFKQFKGYQSLITVNQTGSEEEKIDDRPEISEFQDIDPKFINIILDTLQSFKLFKLCLFVCNRYHLPAKAGRYLISLGLKYSTNCVSNNAVNPILLAPSNFRKTQIEKGILASIALHALYENVNAEFLKIKVTDREEDNKNSLGLYFIKGLLLQGLYKKAVFMVNPQEALKILANYNDFEAYRTIFNQKFLKKQQGKQSLQFLPSPPKNNIQTQYTKMVLKKVLFELSLAMKFQSISQRYYRQFPITVPQLDKLSYQIPDYLPFTKLFLIKKEQFADDFKNLIAKGFEILTKGSDVEVFDFIGVFLLTIHNEEFQQHIVKEFNNDEFLEFYRCAKHIELVLKKYKGSNTMLILQAVMFMHQCFRIQYCKSMSFMTDSYCFVHRTSTVANELVENSKNSEKHFAFFFEQDYNLILSKTSKVSQIISKKYEKALIKFYTKRVNFKREFNTLLPSDYVALQQQNLLRKALSREIELLMDPKARKKATEKVTKVKKIKEKVISYDFKCRGLYQAVIPKDESSSEEEQHSPLNSQFVFYRANFCTKLKYMAPIVIDLFLEHSKNAKETVDGKDLYCSGLNSFYKEYTSKKGGFNLYDAIQFKKFKRVDLYAENVLSVIDNLSLYAKHNFLVEVLTLLLIQYKAIEEPKGFTLEVSNNELKYFQGLKFVKSKDSTKQGSEDMNNEQINFLLTSNQRCCFEYENKYVSEMGAPEIQGLICDYLDILKDEEASKEVEFSTLILAFVLNVKSSEEISESLRRIINLYAKYWKCQTLHSLTDSRTTREFQEKRSHLMEAAYKTILQPIHSIAVTNVGNLKKAIEESEFDYEVENRIMEGRKKAAKKIVRWWKAKRQELKEKKKEGTYLQLAVDSTQVGKKIKPNDIKDIRLAQAIYSNRNVLQDINLMLNTERARDELLSFLLTKTITSSLDFHFVLMSLNKIEECRQHYFQYCGWDPEEIHEFEIGEIKEEMNSLMKTIEIWKKDEKWMREKNVDFKKKKVFEVKWMTKNLGLSNILKKRAGLKKQELLQRKKKILKHQK